MEVMIKSVARFYHWTPTEIDFLYLDAVDHHGVEYWYNDAIEYEEESERRIAAASQKSKQGNQ